MERFIASIFGAIGNLGAGAGTKACWYWFLDEAEMPKHMIEK